jgi:small subunit ribosomal protein S3
VIGPKGAEVDNLKSALESLTNRRVNINIVEVRNPDLSAKLLAEGIAEQLKRRASFRRAMKQRAESTMQAGAKGVKIQVSGRLGGAEMSRSETTLLGSIPLHTLEADVDYSYVPCHTTYGVTGIKVWIFRGLFGEQPSEEELARNREAMGANRRRRRPADGGGGARQGGQSGRGRGGQNRGGNQPQAAAAPVEAPAPAPVPAEAPPAEPAAPVADTENKE